MKPQELPKWLTEPGHLNFIEQLATEPHPTFLKGVPVITDFAQSDVDRKALGLAFMRLKIAYAFTAPPDGPADRVKALRDAFDAAVKDPEFLVEAERMNADIAPVSGAQIAALLAEAYALPKDVIARAKAAMAPP